MGTMEGWATRKANEAAERAGRDNAMKILGAREERASVRGRLLDTVRRIAFTAQDGGAGGAEAVVVLRSELLAALDRICPPEKE